MTLNVWCNGTYNISKNSRVWAQGYYNTGFLATSIVHITLAYPYITAPCFLLDMFHWRTGQKYLLCRRLVITLLGTSSYVEPLLPDTQIFIIKNSISMSHRHSTSQNSGSPWKQYYFLQKSCCKRQNCHDRNEASVDKIYFVTKGFFPCRSCTRDGLVKGPVKTGLKYTAIFGWTKSNPLSTKHPASHIWPSSGALPH